MRTLHFSCHIIGALLAEFGMPFFLSLPIVDTGGKSLKRSLKSIFWFSSLFPEGFLYHIASYLASFVLRWNWIIGEPPEFVYINLIIMLRRITLSYLLLKPQMPQGSYVIYLWTCLAKDMQAWKKCLRKQVTWKSVLQLGKINFQSYRKFQPK